MSKSLEALNYVWYNYYTEELSQDEVEEIEKNLNIVQNELKRLDNQDDVIDNCIKCLEADMPKSAITMLYALRDRKRRVC